MATHHAYSSIMHPRFKLAITSPVALTKLTVGELKAELAHNRRASAVPKLKNAWSVHGKARSSDEALLPTRLGSEERASDAAAEVPLLESHETTRFRTLLQTMLEKHMNSGIKQLVFVIGGPYGFSKDVYNKANGKLSLSKMTFSHQMIRLFFIEQLYRGFTILRNEPYHHR